jgi:hypothetical protein
MARRMCSIRGIRNVCLPGFQSTQGKERSFFLGKIIQFGILCFNSDVNVLIFAIARLAIQWNTPGYFLKEVLKVGNVDF